MRSDAAGAAGVRDAVEAISADVCGNWHFDGQRSAQEGEDVGALAGEADEPDLQVGTDAGAAIASVGATVDGVDAADGTECGDAGRGAVRGAAEELEGDAKSRICTLEDVHLRFTRSFCVAGINGNVLFLLRYRKGMFGKRGEIPPLPRNCDARTDEPGSQENWLWGLGVRLTRRHPTDRPMDIGKGRAP